MEIDKVVKQHVGKVSARAERILCEYASNVYLEENVLISFPNERK